jgi:2-polyprenyl-6-methoxyphenol hydroxylase-like FAD-dependent oxidoreductase
VNWIGVAESEEDVFDPHVAVDVWGRGERFGIVPITSRVAYFAGGALSPLGEARQEALLPMLRARFAQWPDPVRVILAKAIPDSLREIYVHDHDPIDTWHRGKVLLVGDAAHAPLPTSGQGACQALEDAFHIAQLMDQGADLAPSVFFPRFVEVRRAKANAIIAAGRGFAGVVFNSEPGFVTKRNRQSQQSDLSAAAEGMARLWSMGLPKLQASASGPNPRN